MHQIDTPTNVLEAPAPISVMRAAGYFASSISAGGAALVATNHDQDFDNAQMMELINIVLWGGLDPTKGVWTQARDAIQAKLNALAIGNRYQFDVAAPPAPLNLSLYDRALITFEGVESVPLNITTEPGLYKIAFAVTDNNSTNSDLFLAPNNATFSDAFSAWIIEASGQQMTAFGTATAQPSFTAITASPFASVTPQASIQYLSKNQFYMDNFAGPASGDTIDGIGPFVGELLVSTVTAAKMVKASQGIAGGGSTGFSRWADTTTPYTSLGTLTVGAAVAATISGAAIVERMW